MITKDTALHTAYLHFNFLAFFWDFNFLETHNQTTYFYKTAFSAWVKKY